MFVLRLGWFRKKAEAWRLGAWGSRTDTHRRATLVPVGLTAPPLTASLAPCLHLS